MMSKTPENVALFIEEKITYAMTSYTLGHGVYLRGP